MDEIRNNITPETEENTDDFSFDFLNTSYEDMDLEDQLILESGSFPSIEAFMQALTQPDTTLVLGVGHGTEEDVAKTFTGINVDCQPAGDYLMIQIKPAESVAIVQAIFQTLEDAGKRMMTNEDDADLVVTLTFAPAEFMGSAVLTCVQPIFWALSTENFATPCESLRLLFPGDRIGVFQTTISGEDEFSEEETDDIDGYKFITFQQQEQEEREKAVKEYHEKYGRRG